MGSSYKLLFLLCVCPHRLLLGRYPRDQKRLELLNKLDVLDVASSAAASSSSSSGSAGAAQQPSTLTISRSAMLDQEATPLHEVCVCVCVFVVWERLC